MKKLFIATVLVSLMAVVKAEAGSLLDTPEAPGAAQASADYGGVAYSSVSFSSGNVLCFTGQGVISWINLSSVPVVNGVQFLIIRDTASLTSGAPNTPIAGNVSAGLTDYSTNDEIWRLNIATNSGVNWVSTPNEGGVYYRFDPPLRVKRGLAVKSSIANFQRMTVGWQNFGVQQ